MQKKLSVTDLNFLRVPVNSSLVGLSFIDSNIMSPPEMGKVESQ